jgi:hypothetical protein
VRLNDRDVQSNLLFSSRGGIVDFRDPDRLKPESSPKWLPPELKDLPGDETRLLPMDDKQKADVYSLGATIVEVRSPTSDDYRC